MDSGNANEKSKPSTDEAKLQELSERLRNGDSTAVAEIWDFCGNELRRRARTRLRQYGVVGQAESMDICNAVLLDLVRKEGINIRNPNDLVRYVSRAIDHQVLDLLKSLTRNRRDIRRNAGGPVEDHNVTNEDSTPSVVMMRDEVLNAFREELGDNGQQILSLYLANCGWKEIGERLNMAPDAARMRWSRAVQSLRDRYGEIELGDA
ncbi:MAG: RNA polymerase sigma factor [Planctomycetaceae bacterium]